MLVAVCRDVLQVSAQDRSDYEDYLGPIIGEVGDFLAL